MRYITCTILIFALIIGFGCGDVETDEAINSGSESEIVSVNDVIEFLENNNYEGEYDESLAFMIGAKVGGDYRGDDFHYEVYKFESHRKAKEEMKELETPATETFVFNTIGIIIHNDREEAEIKEIFDEFFDVKEG